MPPSETKESGGGKSFFNAQNLRFDKELGKTRQIVREELEALSSDLDAAKKNLKVGERAAKDIANNLTLDSQGTMPAIERYTGVLYDALDASTMPDAAREWVNQHVFIQSALFGLIGASDQIPSYRLSAGSRLPGLKDPLKKTWNQAHTSEVWTDELVIDMRSKDYAALAPAPGSLYLEVVTRDADGEMRALNHFNKAAKGELVRRLAACGKTHRTVADLVEWAKSERIDLTAKGESLVLVTHGIIGKQAI